MRPQHPAAERGDMQLSPMQATVGYSNIQWLFIPVPFFSVSDPDSRFFAESGCGSRLFLNPDPIRMRIQTKILYEKILTNLKLENFCDRIPHMAYTTVRYVFLNPSKEPLVIFSHFWGTIMASLDPDSQSGSADPVESGSEKLADFATAFCLQTFWFGSCL